MLAGMQGDESIGAEVAAHSGIAEQVKECRDLLLTKYHKNPSRRPRFALFIPFVSLRALLHRGIG